VGGGSASRKPTEITFPNGGRSQSGCFRPSFQSTRIGSGPADSNHGSPLHQLTGFYLTVDCRSAGCGGERTFAISDLAVFYKDRTVGEVLA